MIDIPKKIKATGHNCVVAAVAMVCMYWRKKKPTLSWHISEDLESPDWNDFSHKGEKYIKSSGMPTDTIIRFLKNLNMPLNPRLEHLTNSHQLIRLLDDLIPPIVLYNQDYYLREEKGIGHAAILVDKTAEQFITFDSSFYPKCVHPVSKKEFEEAWNMEQNSTIIISPKSVKFRREEISSRTRTIDTYVTAGVVQK
jgi:hypothetical protein